MSSGRRPAPPHRAPGAPGAPEPCGGLCSGGSEDRPVLALRDRGVLCVLIRKAGTATCARLPRTGHSEALDSEEVGRARTQASGPRWRSGDRTGTAPCLRPTPGAHDACSPPCRPEGCRPEGSGPPGPPGPESAPRMPRAPRPHSNGGWLCSSAWPLGTGPWEAQRRPGPAGDRARGGGSQINLCGMTAPGLCDVCAFGMGVPAQDAAGGQVPGFPDGRSTFRACCPSVGTEVALEPHTSGHLPLPHCCSLRPRPSLAL